MSVTRKIGSIEDVDGTPIVEMLAAPNALSDDADPVSQGLYILSETIIRGIMPAERRGGLGGEFGYGVDFENDIFAMRPYYWGNCTCGADETGTEHAATCALRLPNFIHKATGQTICWYKWIGRDMEADSDPIQNWGRIFTECWESLPQEAKDIAEKERLHESTPEYRAERDAAMHSMMRAMEAVFNSLEPCFVCSEDEAGFVGGETHTSGGVKIVRSSHNEDGSCRNCGHTNTAEEDADLAQRKEIQDAADREWWSRHTKANS